MASVIKSPLPGSVWELKVAVGDTVEEDQVVMILEAMKMENEISTDFDGKVSKILVEKGTVVKAGDPLMEIE